MPFRDMIPAGLCVIHTISFYCYASAKIRYLNAIKSINILIDNNIFTRRAKRYVNANEISTFIDLIYNKTIVYKTIYICRKASEPPK